MKKLIVLIVCAAVIVIAAAAGAETIEATFSPGSDDASEVCIMVADAPDIAQRWNDGTLTNLSGQCTTEAGQTSVTIANITPGKSWYFVGLFRDKTNHGIIGEWSNEMVLNVPLKVITVSPLPMVPGSDKKLLLELTLQ